MMDKGYSFTYIPLAWTNFSMLTFIYERFHWKTQINWSANAIGGKRLSPYMTT